MKTMIPLLMIAAILGYFFATHPKRALTDQEQIQAALAEGERAAEDHDIPALLGLVSKDYKDDAGLNREKLRLLLADAFRNQSETWVTLNDEKIDARDDEANVSVFVTLEGRARDSGASWRNDYPLTLHFKKEPGISFLVFPTKRWRVVSAEGIGSKWDGDLLGL
jgi:hypothetical protein